MRDLQERIGYRFEDPSLLSQALRHASKLVDDPCGMSYQRLEFLGDALLNFFVAEDLYERYPGAGEGELSRARSAAINNRNLFFAGERLGVDVALKTDSSVRGKGGGITRKMVADVVEALIGAIYLDGGMDPARRFVISSVIAGTGIGDSSGEFDSKSRLQELCQKRKEPLPEYVVQGESGPPHAPFFRVRAKLFDGNEAEGVGRTKKEAEMDAASNLLSQIGTKTETN